MATMEKKGVATGQFVIHPLSGDKLPVFVANYVLWGYGEGAVMAVPAHDERDFDFANKYSLPITQVYAGEGKTTSSQWQDWYAIRAGLTTVNSGKYDNLDFTAAFDAIVATWRPAHTARARPSSACATGASAASATGAARSRSFTANLRRCTGAGRPAAGRAARGCSAGWRRQPAGANARVLRTAPARNAAAQPSVKPTPWTPSSSRPGTTPAIASPHYTGGMVDPAAANHWLPVDQYIGGIEHAILHLLYARFFHKLMRDEGLVSSNEPFKNLLTQGMVVAETYYRTLDNGGKDWFNPADVELERDGKAKVISARLKADGLPVEIGGTEKMSKSKNNGVDPQSMIDQFGADTCRLFMMFASPPDMSCEWSDAGVEGAHRFLRRVWRLAQSHVNQGVAGRTRPRQPD